MKMKMETSQAFLIMSMIILLHADLISSLPSEKINTTFSSACGGDCLVGDVVLQAEFSMSHHIGRMLATNYKTVTGNTGNGNRPTVDCPSKEQYRSCLPPTNPGNKHPCGSYSHFPRLLRIINSTIAILGFILISLL